MGTAARCDRLLPGGGYDNDSLANHALHWMLGHARDLGLALDEAYLQPFGSQTDIELHETMSTLYRLLGPHHLAAATRLPEVTIRSDDAVQSTVASGYSRPMAATGEGPFSEQPVATVAFGPGSEVGEQRLGRRRHRPRTVQASEPVARPPRVRCCRSSAC